MWLFAVLGVVVALLAVGACVVDRRDSRAGRTPGSNRTMDRMVRDEKRDVRAMTFFTNSILNNSWTASHRRNRS